MASPLLSSGLALGSEVGLQLLLTPASTNILVRAACTVVGVGVPVYSSFKAVESRDPEEKEEWLVYWCAYGCVSVAEAFADKLLGTWLPYYYHVKLVVLVWLQIPNNFGARYLYTKLLRPFLLRHHARIDGVVGTGRRELTKAVEAHRPELEYLADMARHGTILVLERLRRAASILLQTSLTSAPPPAIPFHALPESSISDIDVAAAAAPVPPIPTAPPPMAVDGGPARGGALSEELASGAAPPPAVPSVTAAPSLEAGAELTEMDPVSPRGWVEISRDSLGGEIPGPSDAEASRMGRRAP